MNFQKQSGPPEVNNDSLSFVEEFNSVIRDAERFLSIVRGSELQRNAIEDLRGLRAKVTELKNDAIDQRDEKTANLLLGYECVVEALIAELEMWILLKQEDPNAAWEKLVTAQSGSCAAIRAHAGFSHVEQHCQKLEEIEKLVFPRQVFLSAGMLVEFQECSICGHEYEDCEHLKGMPYMGKFCGVILREVTKLDHVAIVDHPADKLCRVTEFGVEDGVRDRMTWRVRRKENT